MPNLVLTRRLDERIIIGDDITIQVVHLTGGSVRLAINAPANVSVHREEVYQEIKRIERRKGGAA